MANNDLDKLVQYTSERLAAYMEMSPADRKAIRAQKLSRRGPWHTRWFGMLPSAVILWLRSFKPHN